MLCLLFSPNGGDFLLKSGPLGIGVSPAGGDTGDNIAKEENAEYHDGQGDYHLKVCTRANLSIAN